jgi:outer membrane protein TolC
MNTYTSITEILLRRFVTILLFLFTSFLIKAQEAPTLHQLFDQLKLQPVSRVDAIKIEQAKATQQFANSQLYPNIDFIARYDYASIATAMYPFTPNELLAVVQNQSLPQPFSKNIYRIGATLSMPLFVKSIYTISSQSKLMVHSLEDQRYVNLLKNEAIIVSANANLMYIQQLDSALEKKKLSLLKTKEFVNIKVNNGRSAGSALITINNAINEIELVKNDLALQREEVVASIASLTNVTLSQAVHMELTGTYTPGTIKLLDPLRNKIAADTLAIRSEKEKLLPSLYLQGSYFNNYAQAYNNDLNINGDYATVGVVLKVPLFAKNQYSQIAKSKAEIQISQNEFHKLTNELQVQVKQLESSLTILENSVQLYTNSIKDKEVLLEIARVSLQNDQITIDDYLKYEDDLVLEKTKLLKTHAQIWQSQMKLAVIFGNDIQTIVK